MEIIEELSDESPTYVKEGRIGLNGNTKDNERIKKAQNDNLDISRPLVELTHATATYAAERSSSIAPEVVINDPASKTEKRGKKRRRCRHRKNGTEANTTEAASNVSTEKSLENAKQRIKKRRRKERKHTKQETENTGLEIDLNKYNNQLLAEEGEKDLKNTANTTPYGNDGGIVIDLQQMNAKIIEDEQKNKEEEPMFTETAGEELDFIKPDSEEISLSHARLKTGFGATEDGAKIQIRVNTVQIKRQEKQKKKKRLLIRDQAKFSKFVKNAQGAPELIYNDLFNIPVFCRSVVDDMVYRGLMPAMMYNNGRKDITVSEVEEVYYTDASSYDYKYEYEYEEITEDEYYYEEHSYYEDEYEYYYEEYTADSSLPEMVKVQADKDGSIVKIRAEENDESQIWFADYSHTATAKKHKKKRIPKQKKKLTLSNFLDVSLQGINEKKLIVDSYDDAIIMPISRDYQKNANLASQSPETNKIIGNRNKNSKHWRNEKRITDVTIRKNNSSLMLSSILLFTALVIYICVIGSNELYQRAACIGVRRNIIKNIRSKHTWASKFGDKFYMNSLSNSRERANFSEIQPSFATEQEKQTYKSLDMGHLEGFFGLAPLWFNYRGRWIQRVPESTFEEYEHKRDIMRSFVASQLPFSNVKQIDKCLNYILPQEHESALYSFGAIGKPFRGDRLKGDFNYVTRANSMTDFISAESEHDKKIIIKASTEGKSGYEIYKAVMANFLLKLKTGDTRIRALYETLRTRFIRSPRSMVEDNNDKRVPYNTKHYDGIIVKWERKIFENQMQNAERQTKKTRKQGKIDLEQKKQRVLDVLYDSFYLYE